MSLTPRNQLVSRSGRHAALVTVLAASALSIAACSGIADRSVASGSHPYPAGTYGGIVNVGPAGTGTAYSASTSGSVEGYGGFAGRVGSPRDAELAGVSPGRSDK